MKTTTCSCGNAACATRIARGLVPFCKLERGATPAPVGFATYAEAAKHADGGRVEAAHRVGSGSPKRFVIRSGRCDSCRAPSKTESLVLRGARSVCARCAALFERVRA